MKQFLLIFALTIGVFFHATAQEIKPVVTRAQVVDGDTIPMLQLKEVEVLSLVIPKKRSERKKLSKLVKNVKRVYPYSKLAGMKLRKYEKLLLAAESEKERKKLMKQAEQEINDKYGPELKKLTFSQGKILIKLLDRETGNSSYELLQELRGKFRAFFFQAFARIWGYNLKVKYDPQGEDKQIETIVKMIERGQI